MNRFFAVGLVGWLVFLIPLRAVETVEKSAAPVYPPVPAWTPEAGQREHLRRALTLLASSTPEQRHTVRVLFYGQSITEQAWWKAVADYLRTTYPNANLVIENRAIGGHASQLLVKTAEADLYPFQPDLLIFHVYGSHIEYENIIRRVRERTCADILLQTDHLTRDDQLAEETDPAKLTPKQWDAWMNHSFLPGTAAKYGACQADIHMQWKRYLEANQLKPAALLKDGVHLNAHGEWLMAELLKPYLAPLPTRAGYDPLNDGRVHTIALPWITSMGVRVQSTEFTGTRVDVVLQKRGAGSGERGVETVSVQIDGQKPSRLAALYGFTRVGAFPQSGWPILLKVGSQAPLVAEDWTLRLADVSPDGKSCRFTLRGSVTGDDGEGVSTNRFVSKSGRIVLEPEDWNLAYCYAVFKRAVPSGHEVKWQAVLRGRDTLIPVSGSAPGVENAVTVAQGLAPGKHVIEISGAADGAGKLAVRAYAPEGKVGQ